MRKRNILTESSIDLPDKLIHLVLKILVLLHILS